MSLAKVQGHHILNELYVEASAALLLAYGLKVDVGVENKAAAHLRQTCYVSILSANGDGIQLSSMLKIDRDLVIGLHPLHASGISTSYLEDWCLELNNQLVGRVKNKLLAYGRNLAVGLPVRLAGTDVCGLAPSNSEVRQYFIESAGGQLNLTLATFMGPDVELCEPEGSVMEQEVLTEGVITLF